MTWLKENRRYVVGVVVIVLVIFLALSDLYNISLANRRETIIDYMSAEAFESWLGEMEGIKNVLELATTNLDVREAMNYTLRARAFGRILEWQIEVFPRPPNFAEHLYLHIAGATWVLDKAVSAIATKPPTTLRNLENNTLQEIGNLTVTIENLANLVGKVDSRVNPVQQLEEKGVLNLVINYLKQIEETSGEIWELYGLYG